MRHVIFRCALILAVLSLAACGKGASVASSPTAPTQPSLPPAILAGPGEPGTFQPARCRFILPEGVREGEGVECGYLSVVEQRGEREGASEGRIIMLAVAIFHPPGGAIHPDPVVYLSGGPGASALELIRYGIEGLKPVLATGRDVVLFDQRGVGLSRPALDCPEFDEWAKELLDRRVQDRPISDEEASELALESLRECRAALSEVADLSAYHSASSAADVEDLRLALGYEQVNLWGGSYGTRLALEVMRRYPHGLRSVVLDAVYPPDVDLYMESPANYERALDRLFEACAANEVCEAAYPNMRAELLDTVARLNATPIRREVEDRYTGESHEAWMNGDTILALTFQLLYDSRLRYLLPQQIHAASQGDYAAFEQARHALLRLASVSSRGMLFSVQCHDELAFSSRAAFEAELTRHPQIAGMYAHSLLGGLAYRVCEEWGAGQADPSANQPVYSDVPTLLMTGEFDPVTPPDWGRQAAATLTNAYFFEYPGLGHGASGAEGCPRQMFLAFLEAPSAEPDGACIAAMR